MRQGTHLCSLAMVAGFLVAMPEVLAQEGMNREERRQAEITIWVYNYAELPQQTVDKTKIEIARILNQAEIGTRFIDCPVSSGPADDKATCQERMSPAELAIMIFRKFKVPSGVSRDSRLGWASVFTNGQAGHYIHLSHDHIRESSYPGGFCSPETLAEVAVHEIGHVLFRSLDHSATGLMRASWDRQDFKNAAIGNLLFTPQQAKLLQAEVAARMKLASAEAGHVDGK